MATCTHCAGKGTVVEPVMVWNAIKKEYELLQRAVPCPSCAGRGEV